MGQVIMLGTLLWLIAVIFGAVMYFDREAHGRAGDEHDR